MTSLTLLLGIMTVTLCGTAGDAQGSLQCSSSVEQYFTPILVHTAKQTITCLHTVVCKKNI